MAKDPVCGMNVNEKSAAYKASYEGRDYYFCSKNCMEKFKKENNLPDNVCLECGSKTKKIYKNKVFIVSLVILTALALSYFIPILKNFRVEFYKYVKMIWWAILLGLALGGVIDYLVPREYISKVLAKKSKATIFNAVILGFFMSACSHGILALAIQLHKKGASTPSVVAFLLASPWANLTITIMLIGFFGLKALFLIFGAIFIAIITGLIFQVLESKNLIEENKNSLDIDKDFSIVGDIRKRLRRAEFNLVNLKKSIKGIFEGSVSLSNMVLWWILIGMALASAAGAYVPENIFQNYMGASFLGLIVTLIAATIIEICSEGSSPMAFEIFKQTGAFGNAFVFLMAGVATDYTEIGLLWHNVGKKTALWLPAVTVPQVVILGLIANHIF
jgi:hypothetical protein